MVRLTKKDVPAAAEVLARAFASYPIVVHFYPDETERRRIATPFAAIALSVCVKYGEAYGTSPRLEGVAGWLPPGKSPFGLWQVLRATPFGTILEFSKSRGNRMQDAVNYIDALHRKLAGFPHWYLQIIGTEPARQRKGYSSRLLRPILERLDREGVPCFLDTQKESNVGIYQHFGFKVLSRKTIPGTGLTSWGMLREVR